MQQLVGVVPPRRWVREAVCCLRCRERSFRRRSHTTPQFPDLPAYETATAVCRQTLLRALPVGAEKRVGGALRLRELLGGHPVRPVRVAPVALQPRAATGRDDITEPTTTRAGHESNGRPSTEEASPPALFVCRQPWRAGVVSRVSRIVSPGTRAAPPKQDSRAVSSPTSSSHTLDSVYRTEVQVARLAIQGFADADTEEYFLTGRIRKGVPWQRVARVARRKLDMLHYAAALGDLRSPPGNRLEALAGSLRGMYSVRVNDRWRLLFRWGDNGPEQVRVVDYHW